MSAAALIWPYIDRSVESLRGVAADLTPDELVWRPPAADANSIATLLTHTIANAEDNLLGTLLALPGTYDRERHFVAPDLDVGAAEARWRRLRETFEAALPGLNDARLLAAITHPRRGSITGLEVMLVVARHTAEHLAHAELTRDLLLAERARP